MSYHPTYCNYQFFIHVRRRIRRTVRFILFILKLRHFRPLLFDIMVF